MVNPIILALDLSILTKKYGHVFLNKDFNKGIIDWKEYKSIKENRLFYTERKKKTVNILGSILIYDIIIPIYESYSLSIPPKKLANKEDWAYVIILLLALLIIRGFSEYVNEGI